MMDKKPHIKPYLYGMFAGFGAISLSILFFFLIYRFQGFGNAVSTLTGILMPFIYGSVIAYLLKPVCNWLEAFLHKLFPERMHRFANMLAVALTILFGLLLIYALIMMIVPQLINSVTALYYTARDNIGDFVEWISKQEFIANNKKLLDFIENSYDSLDANLDAWIKNTLLPSMQNILSGAAVGVVNVVTWIKNFIIGLIVSVYLLASRKKFGQQGKLILYSLVKPRWADLIMEEVRYADRMFGGFINGKILDSAIIGVLCYIACLIFKFPSALLVSVIIGVTNVIPFFDPFIVTLATQLITYGLILIFFMLNGNNGQPVSGLSQEYKSVVSAPMIQFTTGSGAKISIPWYVLYAVIFVALMWFIWNKTAFGKNMFAVGSNADAAKVSGVNVFWTTVMVHTLAGAMYGVTGFIEGARISSITQSAGLNYECDAIAACVIGGVSFVGGTGKISGIVLGVFVLRIIFVALSMLGIDPSMQYIIKGGIILAACSLDMRKYLAKK